MTQRATKTPREKDNKRRKRVLKDKHQGKVKGDLTAQDCEEYVRELMANELGIPDQ